MAMNSPSAGDRILASDISGIVNFLTGVSGSGQAATLIYNAAGAVAFQPSSDPAAGTELFQIKNNAGTRQIALTSDGKIKFADGTTMNTGITTATNALSGDVTMTSANTYYDGPSVSLTAGTWLVVGTVTINQGTSAAFLLARLWDGTTTYASAEHYALTTGASGNYAISISAIVTPGSTTTYKISCATGVTGAKIKAAAPNALSTEGNTASHLRAIKVG